MKYLIVWALWGVAWRWFHDIERNRILKESLEHEAELLSKLHGSEVRVKITTDPWAWYNRLYTYGVSALLGPTLWIITPGDG